MEKADFIKLVRTAVRDSAVKSNFEILITPPGKEPNRDLVEISEWFNSLTKKDREMVRRVAEMTLDQGIYNFLCILDGVKGLGKEYSDGNLVLLFKNKNKEVVINDKEKDFEELHDIYNLEVGRR